MTSAAEKYVNENHWVWGIVGTVITIFAITVTITCILCCVHRRRKRRRNGIYYVNLRANLEDSLQYGSMELQRSLNDSPSSTSFTNALSSTSDGVKTTKREVGVAEAWNSQRKRREMSEREAAQLACQYYLRNTKTYTLTNPLPDLGSRVAKYWFLVSLSDTRGQSSNQRVLTLQPVSKHCPIRLQRENLKLVNKLLTALKHPYLQSVEYVDYLPEQLSVVMVMTFFPQGSLKDVIYKKQPTLEWSDKYSIRRRGLAQTTVALYGRQILEALRHLLFEMMCGYELTTLSPSDADLANVRGEAQVEVLRYIFSGTANDRPFPNIVEILNLPFFKTVKLPDLDNWDSSQIQLSAEMKGLLRSVRKGRSEVARDQERLSQKRRSFAKHENYYPVTSAPAVSRGTFTTSTPSQSSRPPPPPLSHPPPPSTSHPHTPTPPTEERGALLTQIRGGTKLKRTVTNDRSAPKI